MLDVWVGLRVLVLVIVHSTAVVLEKTHAHLMGMEWESKCVVLVVLLAAHDHLCLASSLSCCRAIGQS